MELIINVPDMSDADLAILAEAARHSHLMQRAQLEWLEPRGDGGGSCVRSCPVTAVREPGELPPRGGTPGSSADIAGSAP